ncbi:polymerase I and transcript release factor [Silurus meridionalis]|nr:polymerase I and transcript release factor [Silurus meridionalis]
MAMAETNLKLDHVALREISDDDDDEVVLVTAAAKTSVTTPASNRKHVDEDDSDDEDDDHEVDLKLGLENSDSQKSEAQATGMMVLALLDKIIGVVDQIQLTQNGLESRQMSMEKNMTSIQSELNKLAKSQGGTAGTATKLLEKVRKVNVNVKSVRGELERQAGQIKKLENNEHELLKRKNFKVLIFQEKQEPVKPTVKPEAAVSEGAHVLREGEQGTDDVVEVEEIVEESRVARIKRSGLQRVDEIKKAFSKEQMEKTKQRTKENLEKTRQRTKENLEKTRVRTRENLQKTRVTIGKKMGKLGTKIRPSKERKEKIRVSREKIKKSRKSENKVYARSRITTYRVPPFTFYVKKIREGVEVEPEPEEELEDEEVEELQAEDQEDEKVEEAELVNLRSPEVALEAAEYSQLVIKDSVQPQGKASQ